MIGDASNLPVKEFCYLRTNLLTAAVRKICLEEGWKGSKGKFQETSGEQEINPQRSEPDVGSQIYFSTTKEDWKLVHEDTTHESFAG